jgi:hypothetical protein
VSGTGLVVAGLLICASFGNSAPAGDDKKPDEKKPDEKKSLTFKADVAPLLKDACASCHSGAKQKARLDVTSSTPS